MSSPAPSVIDVPITLVDAGPDLLPISGWSEALCMIGRKVAITLNGKLGLTLTNGLLMSKGSWY